MFERVIDLHAHTTCSDGSASPSELVRLAAQSGASAVAITDHDTTTGLAEGRATAEEIGIEFVDGVEISAEYPRGTMHILGYCIDASSSNLETRLAELRVAREQRNPRIAERLQELGLNVDYQEVVETAANDVVGRPHFARLLVSKGYVGSIQEAFDRYLAKGAPAYVEKKRLSPPESISLIHEAGGVAVLAHPYQLKTRSDEELDAALDELAAHGLDGIEAIYSRHKPEHRAKYSEMAARRGLLITGGSDYHGSYKPDISIVTGLGDLRVPYELLEQVRSRAAALALR